MLIKLLLIALLLLLFRPLNLWVKVTNDLVDDDFVFIRWFFVIIFLIILYNTSLHLVLLLKSHQELGASHVKASIFLLFTLFMWFLLLLFYRSIGKSFKDNHQGFIYKPFIFRPFKFMIGNLKPIKVPFSSIRRVLLVMSRIVKLYVIEDINGHKHPIRLGFHNHEYLKRYLEINSNLFIKKNPELRKWFDLNEERKEIAKDEPIELAIKFKSRLLNIWIKLFNPQMRSDEKGDYQKPNRSWSVLASILFISSVGIIYFIWPNILHIKDTGLIFDGNTCLYLALLLISVFLIFLSIRIFYIVFYHSYCEKDNDLIYQKKNNSWTINFDEISLVEIGFSYIKIFIKNEIQTPSLKMNTCFLYPYNLISYLIANVEVISEYKSGKVIFKRKRL